MKLVCNDSLFYLWLAEVLPVKGTMPSWVKLQKITVGGTFVFDVGLFPQTVLLKGSHEIRPVHQNNHRNSSARLRKLERWLFPSLVF